MMTTISWSIEVEASAPPAAIVPVPFFLEVHAGTKRGVCQSDGNVSGLSDGASSGLSRTRIFFPVLK